MDRDDNRGLIRQLLLRLHVDFGELAPAIIKIMAEEVGGARLIFPDMKALCRSDRNSRIRADFKGNNHEDLAIKYGIKKRQVRRIVQNETAD
ncbi:MAG: hypothetical protein FDZ69_13715 [Deltaproteobacteria bacterium]|nr:MAG: hypothetical protein FDZ69_13715 [Deltaproteobacteria bacterium]